MIDTILAMGLATAINAHANIYSQTLAVVENDNNIITCVDFNGTEWSFEDEEEFGWERGDLVSAIMSDNGTDIVYDDSILVVRYDGWVDGYWGWDNGNVVAEFN